MKLLKKISILFLLFSASILLPSSFAAAAGRLYSDSKFPPRQSAKVVIGVSHEEAKKYRENEKAVKEMHEKVLRANMGDYGNYEQAPTMDKPPFKLIPN